MDQDFFKFGLAGAAIGFRGCLRACTRLRQRTEGNTRINRHALLFLAAIVATLLLFSAEAGAQEHNAPKVEVGPQFSSLSINSLGFYGTENVAGFGGRITYNLNDYFAVEAVGNILPTGMEPQFATGGTAQQAQFGIKVGKRYNRFGVFAKVRPGFVSFGNTLKLTSSLVQRVPGGVFSPLHRVRLGAENPLLHGLGRRARIVPFAPNRRAVRRR